MFWIFYHHKKTKRRKKELIPSIGKDKEKLELSYPVGGNKNLYIQFGESVTVQNPNTYLPCDPVIPLIGIFFSKGKGNMLLQILVQKCL